jgi:aryl-alcohol dehydrogenase-like predicted oxidoreductase
MRAIIDNSTITASLRAMGYIRSPSKDLPRFQPDAMRANQSLVNLLAQVARRHEATTAQVALAWVLAQKRWIVPIPGTTRLSRLEENLAASDLSLTVDDLREVDAEAAKVQGARYPQLLEDMTNR